MCVGGLFPFFDLGLKKKPNLIRLDPPTTYILYTCLCEQTLYSLCFPLPHPIFIDIRFKSTDSRAKAAGDAQQFRAEMKKK